jgi:DNA-binding response OmpR family regulator
MKLLIVEDEVRMVDLLCKGLTEEGHTVVCAADGAEGLALARSYEFDVIILDLMMPKLNGYDLAQRLRGAKVRTPILMLTARDSVPDIVRGLDVGADDYMTKPFSFDELVARLRAVKRRGLQAEDTYKSRRSGSRPGAPGSFAGRRSSQFDAHRIQSAGATDVPCG